MCSLLKKLDLMERQKLEGDLIRISGDPLLSELLQTTGHGMALLTRYRRVIAVNGVYLKMIGIEDAGDVLGLKPGATLNCIYAGREPDSCGTHKACETCGAAVAIAAAKGGMSITEQLCSLTSSTKERSTQRTLSIRARPITLADGNFILLLVQDITVQHQRTVLERTFFHEVYNMLNGLMGASTLLSRREPESNLVQMIHKSAHLLKREIDIQKRLIRGDSYNCQPCWENVAVKEIFSDLQERFKEDPVSYQRSLLFQENDGDVVLKTDRRIVGNILKHMIINALEATEYYGVVKVSVKAVQGEIQFAVWNQGVIPGEVAERIFQRHFTTKQEHGRGIGTYTIKLLGEKILGGRVSFESVREKGTTFYLTLF